MACSGGQDRSRGWLSGPAFFENEGGWQLVLVEIYLGLRFSCVSPIFQNCPPLCVFCRLVFIGEVWLGPQNTLSFNLFIFCKF
jgi:hypothetical protein